MEARERQKKEREDQLRRKKEVENDDEERLRREKTDDSTTKKNERPGSRKWGERGDGNDDERRGGRGGNRRMDVKSIAKGTSNEAVPDRESTSMEANGKKAANDRQRPMRPERGTPRGGECGCYGNVHRALANCLACGRIVCEVEGANDYCHFCGHYVDLCPPAPCIDGSTGDEANDDARLASAIRHKERLLEYQRTSASRTTIHDDQEDYFVTSNSAWSTDREREEHREMEERRRREVQDRKSPVLRVNF
jgi:hypothetical protein